ncbi:hypothetical protein [Geodermatophilus sp. URMC 64]
MRTPRRLVTLVLAASAGLSLAACSSTVHATASPAPTAQEETSEAAAPPIEEAGDTGAADPGTEDPGTEATGSDDLPIPGGGVPGNDGLCQAVVGWFGYVGLSLLAVDENGEVNPSDVVPLLEQLRDAPRDHRDADAALLDAADDVSAATGQVITDVESGGDLYTAIGGLEEPVTAFGNACTAAGVTV